LDERTCNCGRENKEILEMDEDDRFISLIPVGVPAYTPRDKRMKELQKCLK